MSCGCKNLSALKSCKLDTPLHAAGFLISGHGINLIAGYNIMSLEEKEKINIKKYVDLLVLEWQSYLFMTVLINVLLANFVYVALVVIDVDCLMIIILNNIVCEK